MHKSNTYYCLFLVLAALLISSSSCKKLLEPANAPTLSLSSLRKLMSGSGYPGYDDVFQQGLVFMDDDVQHLSPVHPQPELPAEVLGSLPAFSWMPDFYESLSTSLFAGSQEKFNSWFRYYEHIATVNTVLEQLERIPENSIEKSRLRGEALTLRAYYYFMLVNLYAQPYQTATLHSPGVPLLLKAAFTREPTKRAEVLTVYDQIIQDMEAACTILDSTGQSRTVYRIGPAAAHALASRIYLYMSQWEKVILHGNRALALQPGLMHLADWGTPDPVLKGINNATNPETIWAFGSLEEYYPEGFTANYTISSELINLFSENDLRKQIYLLPCSPEEVAATRITHSNGKRAMPGSTPQTGKSLRVAEVYLNLAEAYLQQYRTKANADYLQLSLQLLKTLRENRFKPGKTTPINASTPEKLLDFCRLERRLEFFGEDQRWFDLRRYGMPAIRHRLFTRALNSFSAGLIYILGQKDPQYVWQIPSSAIRLNPALEQNPVVKDRLVMELRSAGR